MDPKGNTPPRFLLVTTLSLGLASVFFLPRWLLGRWAEPNIFGPEEAPEAPVAVVFGAGLRRDGRPTAVLADRVRAAVDLYRRGKVRTLLLSGAARADGHHEAQAMAALARDLGVPKQDIWVDEGGTRTFETCRRAASLFGVRRALLVSQRYHLPRALLTCKALGIQATGVSADLRSYRPVQYRFWTLREVPATVVALWDILTQPHAAGHAETTSHSG